MKKSIVALTLVFALLFSFAACRKIEKNEEVTEMQTEAFAVDANGEKHSVQADVDEEGNTKYFYIDKNGEQVTVDNNNILVETKPVKVIQATEPDGSPTPEAQSILDMFKDSNNLDALIDSTEAAPTLAMGEELITEKPKKTYKKPVGKDGKPLPYFGIGSEKTTASSGGPKNEPTKANQTQGSNGGSNGGSSSGPVDYNSILSSNRFTVSFSLKTKVADEEMTIPITYSRSGDKHLVETKMPISNEGTTDCRFLIRDNQVYMILPSLKSYYSTPTAEAEDLDLDEIIDLGSNEGKYIGSEDVVVDGKTYTRDIYEEENGTKTMYYYLNGELKRIETMIGEDHTILEFNYIKAYVNSNVFDVPVGYLDLSKVMNQTEQS